MANTSDNKDELKTNTSNAKPIGNKPQRHLRNRFADNKVTASEASETVQVSTEQTAVTEPVNETTDAIEQKIPKVVEKLWWQNT